MALVNASMSDEALIRRIAAERDEEAFELFAQRHGGALYAVALHLTSDRMLAEDVVQEALLGLWRSAKNHDSSRGQARAWLLSLAAHKALRLKTRARGRGSRADQPSSASTGVRSVCGAERAAEAEAVLAVQRLLSGLPDLERKLVALAYGAGLTQNEIASTLRMPQTTVSIRLRKALQGMKEELHKAGLGSLSPAELLSQVTQQGQAHLGSLVERAVRGLSKGGEKGTRSGAWSGRVRAPWLKVLLPVLVLALLAGVGLRWAEWNSWQPKRPVEPLPTAPLPRPPVSRFARHWDFASPVQLREFQRLLGSVQHDPQNGQDGQGCLVLGRDTTLGLSLPVGRLPLRVRFGFQDLGAASGGSLSWGRESIAGATVFREVGHRFTPDGRWHSETFFLTAQTIDRYLDGFGRSGFWFCRAPDREALLQIQFLVPARLDEIRVEEIPLAEVPDYEPFARAQRRLGSRARPGIRIPVPELKPFASPGRDVLLEVLGP